jgi:hypothetical protein
LSNAKPNQKKYPMTLVDFIKSINETKVNLITTSDSPQAAAKVYPQFPIARLLSYQKQLIGLVNEVNMHNIGNKEHYETLLYLIPKGRRFARLEKPEKATYTKTLMDTYGVSENAAREICYVLTEDQLTGLVADKEYGGTA